MVGTNIPFWLTLFQWKRHFFAKIHPDESKSRCDRCCRSVAFGRATYTSKHAQRSCASQGGGGRGGGFVRPAGPRQPPSQPPLLCACMFASPPLLSRSQDDLKGVLERWPTPPHPCKPIPIPIPCVRRGGTMAMYFGCFPGAHQPASQQGGGGG